MAATKFKSVSAVLMGILLLLIAAVAFELVQPDRPRSRAPLPNPNGYDDFVKAGQILASDPGNFRDLAQPELRALVEANLEAAARVRLGLTHKCRISIDFSKSYFTLRMPEIAAGRRLAQVLGAEGRLAELEGRTNDAVELYLETIQFGQESSRGGVLIDRRVGIDYQTIGVVPLQKALATLDARTCRAAAKQLEQMVRQREPISDVLINEREWIRRSSSIRERIQALIPIESLNQSKRIENNFLRKCNQSELQLGQLMIDLAARAYELEHGQHPKSLNELVPAYLSSIPVDPTTGTNLTYLP